MPTCTMCNIHQTVKILVRSRTIEKKFSPIWLKIGTLGLWRSLITNVEPKKSEFAYCGFCGLAKPKPIYPKAQNLFLS